MLRRRTVSLRVISLVATTALTLVACGGDDDDAVSSGTAGSTAATTDTVTDLSLVPATQPTASVPDVQIPASIPTELVKTVITPGEGEPAVDGQIVVVDYVGVRSEDGEQFDTSYGRDPLAVTLGSGGVIPGWEQGLVGSTQGERLQLDIPAELAYGDEPRGDVIQAGDALTFLIDVRSVVPGAPPVAADIVTSPEPSTGPSADDIRPGSGATIGATDTGLFHIAAFQRTDAAQLSSTWEPPGQPAAIPMDDPQLGDVAELIVGMQVGGRRSVILPADEATGQATDVVLILDLLAVT